MKLLFISIPNRTMKNVPSKKFNILFCLVYLMSASVLTSKLFVKCEPSGYRPTTSQYYDDSYFDSYLEEFDSQDGASDNQPRRIVLSSEPTPALDSLRYSRWTGEQFDTGNKRYHTAQRNEISPAKVRLARQEILFSPIFNPELINQNDLGNNHPYQAAQKISTQHVSLDTSNNLELVEPGSGSEWNQDQNQLFDDTTNIMEDSTTVNEYDATSTAIMPTSVTSNDILSTPTAMDGEVFNRAPQLIRRLPKFSITAGQFWKYFIPFDTFIDEDGDLRQLKSAILSKRLLDLDYQNKSDSNYGKNDNEQEIGTYYSWLQFDKVSQLLYGLPTENDIGRHTLMLKVSDQWGATSDETIEINVKPHQSGRAFTHLFVIDGVEYEAQRYTSMVDAVGEFIKRITRQIYFDEPLKSIVVQNYNINNQELGSNNHSNELEDKSYMKSFTISWSNSSLPIYPCNLNQLDHLSKLLIDTRASESWSLERGEKSDLPPSPNLFKLLKPEFKPTSISIVLQGACEGRSLSQSDGIPAPDSSDSDIKINNKIGKLTWQLGAPIEYQIPSDTFANGKGVIMTRELQLSVHTIEGLILSEDSKFSFLEFDQGSQTLFGTPYDQSEHSGQKEVVITARHPINGMKIREVFIISIEPQDLTTINNRAFMMSLYLFARSGIFGPKERVSLSHKIAGSLGTERREFGHDKENSEMIIVEIQKFAMKGVSMDDRMALLEPESYLDKIIRVPDHTGGHEENLGEGGFQNIFFYKYTWTNGTIGYRGDCPVEVIKEYILFALEQSMLELKVPGSIIADERTKNDSTRFYNRLRYYFEPETDLIHLRFEPIGACMSVLELHDVGNGDVADQADRASEVPIDFIPEVTTLQTIPLTPKVDIEPNNDEYWSIIVLIILVIALIFVIIMFFMGMHTYKINQDKRFELQVKLAQARQNSMYLSNMILANQAMPGDLCDSMLATPGIPKSIYVVQEEEKGSRKPVILDNEKQLLTSNQQDMTNLQPTAVQLTGQTVHTMPLKPTMTFTLDSIASNLQPTLMQSPSRMMHNYMNERQYSMTLNSRSSNPSIHRASIQQPLLHQSQSILTVASLAGPLPMIPQGRLPVVYAQVPFVNSNSIEQAQNNNYSSLQRTYSHQRPSDVSLANRMFQMRQASYVAQNESVEDQAKNYPQRIQQNGTISIGTLPNNKMRSPSYSSSNSATTQSVISNPNYVQT